MLIYFDNERRTYVVETNGLKQDLGMLINRLERYEKLGLEPDEIELIKNSKANYEQGINEYNGLKKQLEEVSDEYKSLRKRLSHLLESDFIASFDDINMKTWEYKRNIKEADALMHLDRLRNNDDYAATVKQLEELITDRESFLEGDTEHDDIYKKDIIALKTAISALEKHKGMLERVREVLSDKGIPKEADEAVQKELDRLKRENKELSIENKCLIYENKILRSEL